MAEHEVMTVPVRWPDRRTGPWNIEITWALVDGAAVCVGVSVFGGVRPSSGGVLEFGGNKARPVGAGDLRSIPIGKLVAESRAQWSQWFEERYRDRWPEGAPEDRQRFAEAWTEEHRIRNREWPADHLLQVAAYYGDQVRMLNPAPTRAVATKWGVSKSAAAKWIGRCRAAGLLGETPRGKAGGVTPPKKKGTKR